MSILPVPAGTNAPMPTASEWNLLRDMAKVAIASQLLPPHVKNEQAAIFIALKAKELNIPTTYGWSNITVIGGKPSCSAELMLALVTRDHGGSAILFEETTDTLCRISYKRRDVAERRELAYTIEQATKAGLTGGNWSKYPAAMLRARCISAVARMAFADSIAGMYTPEELGAAVDVTPDGEVVVAADNLVGYEHRNSVPYPDPDVEEERTPLAEAADQERAGLIGMVRAALANNPTWTPKATRAFCTSAFKHPVKTLDDLTDEELALLLECLTGQRLCDLETGEIGPRVDQSTGEVMEEEPIDATATVA